MMRDDSLKKFDVSTIFSEYTRKYEARANSPRATTAPQNSNNTNNNNSEKTPQKSLIRNKSTSNIGSPNIPPASPTQTEESDTSGTAQRRGMKNLLNLNFNLNPMKKNLFRGNNNNNNNSNNSNSNNNSGNNSKARREEQLMMVMSMKDEYSEMDRARLQHIQHQQQHQQTHGKPLGIVDVSRSHL